MRRRANNYDAQMAQLGYTLFGDRNGESDYYAKDFYNYSYRVYIYMDEGQWWADVHTHGYITGEYGPFESPMSADMYVCNVNGFKGGARRKRAYTRNVTDLEFSKFEHYLLEQANGAETDARYADEGYEQGFYDGKRAAYSDALYRIDQYFDII